VTDADVVAALFARCRDDHAAWINGDPSHYAIPEDGTLMGAFGGTARGGVRTSTGQQRASSLWESGEGDVELVSGGRAGDVVWLVMIERATVHFAGRAEPARWDLRVTELFRSVEGEWQRFHRHADPLVDPHGLDEVLGLLP
jgi:hypothetical protein